MLHTQPYEMFESIRNHVYKTRHVIVSHDDQDMLMIRFFAVEEKDEHVEDPTSCAKESWEMRIVNLQYNYWTSAGKVAGNGRSIVGADASVDRRLNTLRAYAPDVMNTNGRKRLARILSGRDL